MTMHALQNHSHSFVPVALLAFGLRATSLSLCREMPFLEELLREKYIRLHVKEGKPKNIVSRPCFLDK